VYFLIKQSRNVYIRYQLWERGRVIMSCDVDRHVTIFVFKHISGTHMLVGNSKIDI
jgi:hypothetical protein